MPVAVFLLFAAPFVGLSALLLPRSFIFVPLVLAAVLTWGGLLLVYRSLLTPLRRLTTSARAAGDAPLNVQGACPLLREALTALQEREHHRQEDFARMLHEKEENFQEAVEWHEKYSVAITGQRMVRATLDKVADKLKSLAARLPQEAVPEEDAHTRACRVFVTEALENARGELEYCANYLDQMNVFLGETPTAGEKAETDEQDFFQWSESYTTGVPVIDGQHKLLLSYINKLARNVSQGSDPALLLKILDALAGYAFTHFNTEVIFFAASGYTEAGKHIRKHREFRQTVAEFREALDEGRAHIDINLLEFLKVWLIEHIQGMDTGYAPYVRKRMDEHA